MKPLSLILCSLFLFVTNAVAQNSAQISTGEQTYNFGTIAEADGLVSHVFEIKNTGNSPLVITRITASCGCTQPEWTKEPIAPGETGSIKITYNPKGRPGPFFKTITVFSNGKKGNYTLAIKGDVVPKQLTPTLILPYSIGELKMETKKILYSSIRPDETVGEKISVKNEGKTSLTIQMGKTPDYLTVEARPTQLAPDEIGEITVLLDANTVKRKGRITTAVPVTIESIGQEKVDGSIEVNANLIDNFDKQTPTEKAQAPIAQLSGTQLDFGKLPEKSGFIPLGGGKVTGNIDITNTGKSTLLIHSITCDDERVDISSGKKEIKPGTMATFKITLRPKEVKTRMEALIHIICNDPNGPVRLIKITADK